MLGFQIFFEAQRDGGVSNLCWQKIGSNILSKPFFCTLMHSFKYLTCDFQSDVILFEERHWSSLSFFLRKLGFGNILKTLIILWMFVILYHYHTWHLAVVDKPSTKSSYLLVKYWILLRKLLRTNEILLRCKGLKIVMSRSLANKANLISIKSLS